MPELTGEPEFSPLAYEENGELLLPRDRKEINAWCRYYYSTNPIVAIWIDTIASQVYSDFSIFAMPETSKEDLQKIKDEFWPNGGAFKFIQEAFWAIVEVNTIGEVILAGENGIPVILNPDFVMARKNTLTDNIDFSLEPDRELRQLVISEDPKDIELVSTIDPKIIQLIRANENIPLEKDGLTVIQKLGSPYDMRGTSSLYRYFKTLLLDDKNRTNDIKALLAADSQTDAFIIGLEWQRRELEKWILNTVESWAKENGINGKVGINWTNDITKEAFKNLFEEK